MKYKPPEVEEGQDTDDVASTSKRKREAEETPTVEEKSTDEAETQPPNKAAKPDEIPGLDDVDDDLAFLDDDGEFEEGDLDEDLSEEEEGNEPIQEVEQEERGGEDEEEEENEDTDNKDAGKSPGKSPSGEKLQKTIDKYGRGPLEGTAIEGKALTGSPDTILAMLFEAMLKSKPISHDLTDRTIHKLIDVGYHDIQKLGDATWEERAMVLKDGGYNRYREQGSTNLGALVEFVNEKYDGDLNNLIKKADYDRQKTKELVHEVKGLGDLGVELFFNNVQSVWPSIAPFIDSRSLQTAKDVGFGTDLDAIYTDLEKDSVRMCRLANALSAARLERRVGDLMAI
ncbi:hypothetical protein BJY01DRAFT_207217 [Aspergillus pseudoustus]|uniref:Uncharacterized protein n=1 Tax=Aspergillus pseudoustus TaxID=1810923 RepID=A0ABR4KLX1_9EURO